MLRPATLLAFALLVPSAAAQQVLHTFDGDSDGDLYGYAVTGIGDVNGDGCDDLLIGARDDSPGGVSHAGSAFVRSGKTGAQLLALAGTAVSDIFGISVAALGDLSGDGVPDYAVGSSGDEPLAFIVPDIGSARIVNGATGATIRTHYGDGTQSHQLFGASIASAGDWDLDGVPDVVVGAPNWDGEFFGSPVPNAGRAVIYSGATGVQIHAFNGIADNELFGFGVGYAGDVNADGFDEIVVGVPSGSPGPSAAGKVHVFTSKTKTVLFTKNGTQVFGQLGNSVAGGGDVNDDGFADIVVGAYGENSNGGAVKVFLGPAGAAGQSATGAPDDRMGADVAVIGDANRDDRSDYIAGAYQAIGGKAGYAYVWAGQLNISLYGIIQGDHPDAHFGAAVGAAGDVDGDGWLDIIVGEHNYTSGLDEIGRAKVFDVLWHQPSVGAGFPGQAFLEVYGTKLSTGGEADLLLIGGGASKPATLVASASSLPTPFKGGTLVPNLATAALYHFTTSPSGEIKLPALPGGGGPFDVYLQFVIKEPLAPKGFSLSNAVKVSYLP